MGETQTDEQVVKVRLVRLERRHTADDTSAHHAQRVEYRDGKNRQREGNEPEIPEARGSPQSVSCRSVRMTNTEMTTPSTSVPPSPMNILDRCPYTL